MTESMTPNAILERVSKLLEGYLERQKTGPFVDYHSPEALFQLIEPTRETALNDWDALFSWVKHYLDYAVNTGHPGFVNRMWSDANLPSIVGEIITALTNTSACTYESAPVSTLFEKVMIGEMLKLAGFEAGEGQMTTGSSNANMIAMMVARDQIDRTIPRTGLFSQRPLVAFVGAESHYSMDKAAAILGLGTDHLVKIPLDQHGRMQLEELEKQIQIVKEQGGIPFFVGATAGTTVRGAFDPIADLARLRDRYPFWLHVDGAWGGATVLSPSLKEQFMHGLEKVDSFTFDFHKMPGTNLICNILLMNGRKGALRQSCAIGDDSYIFRPASKEEEYNLGSFSLQCGRRVDALKWFLDWKFYGQSGFAGRIEHYLQLSKYAEEVVEKTDELEMVTPRESFNVCFRFQPPYRIEANDFNLKLRTRLYHQAIALIGFGYIGSDLCLRLLITDPDTTRQDIEQIFLDIVRTGNALLEDL